jgi:hypothetical protein
MVTAVDYWVRFHEAANDVQEIVVQCGMATALFLSVALTVGASGRYCGDAPAVSAPVFPALGRSYLRQIAARGAT